MIKREVTDVEVEAARAMMEETPPSGRKAFGIRELASRLGLSYNHARNVMAVAVKDRNTDIEANTNEWTQDDLGNVIAVTRNHQCKTLSELISFFEVDLDEWQVDKHVINQWGKGDLLQVKAWLSRKVEPVV